MSTWYDRNGRPIDVATANRLLGDQDYTRIALTRITSTDLPGNEWFVSTVWLGLDHSWGARPPIIFETMTFGPEDDPFDGGMDRHTTEDQARAGHRSAILAITTVLGNATIAHLDKWPTKEQQ